VNTAPDQPL